MYDEHLFKKINSNAHKLKVEIGRVQCCLDLCVSHRDGWGEEAANYIEENLLNQVGQSKLTYI